MKKELSLLLSYTQKENDCLIWTRCFNTDGYPRAVIEGDSNAKVHRIVYQLATGEDISGKVIRHSCDNPKCINPDHLLSGSFADNGNDKAVRNRQPRVVTREKVFITNSLLNTYPQLRQKEVAELVGIDVRRVSDIARGKYCSATGKFLGHGKWRF